MKTIPDFMCENPGYTFLIIFCTLFAVEYVIRTIIRGKNIKAHGWPPTHCDADGDGVKNENKD